MEMQIRGTRTADSSRREAWTKRCNGGQPHVGITCKYP